MARSHARASPRVTGLTHSDGSDGLQVVSRILKGENVGTVVQFEEDTTVGPLQICQQARRGLRELKDLSGEKRSELLRRVSKVRLVGRFQVRFGCGGLGGAHHATPRHATPHIPITTHHTTPQ